MSTSVRVSVLIVDGPLADGAPEPLPSEKAEAGARLVFEGVVRPEENGRAISALDYEVYEPMAGRELKRIAMGVCEEFGLIALACKHSRGRVPVGRASLRVEIRSRHRGEGLRAMAAFIDRLKQDVPIWKRPVYEGVER